MSDITNTVSQKGCHKMTDIEILVLLQKMDRGYVPNAEEQKELDECESFLISVCLKNPKSRRNGHLRGSMI